MEQGRDKLVDALTRDDSVKNESSKLNGYALLVSSLMLIIVAIYFYVENQLYLEVKTSSAIRIMGSTQFSSLEAVGYVVAKKKAHISSLVSGVITEMNVEEGDYVEKNDLIAHLDDSVIRHELMLAESNFITFGKKISEIKIREEEAKINFIRIKKMVENNFLSQALLDEAEAKLKSFSAKLTLVESEIITARRGLELKENQLEKYKIKAPFSGVVVSKHANVGEMLVPGSSGEFTTTGLCTLIDMTSREIEVDVNEAYIERVFKGQAAEVKLDAYPDWLIRATVINYVPTADRKKATVKVRLKFNELDDRILPDMGIRVKFFDKNYVASKTTTSKIFVPATSVDSEGTETYLWVVVDNVIKKVIVETGDVFGEKIEIIEGIDEADIVVVSSKDKLVINKKVKVNNE